MMTKGKLIERYIVAACLPYFVLSLFLLTAVLVAQQATRFTEIIGTTRAPLRLAAEIILGLLPQILIFTLPMATLTGTALGFSRMGSDRELIAMQAAGVGTWRLVRPMIFMGAVLCVLTWTVGFGWAPWAASQRRRAVLRAALDQLNSPIEPRTFSTELTGKVVYVRDGDRERGEWGRVFMQWQESGGPVRLITARSGRIDSTGEQSELVLSEVVITTFPSEVFPGEGLEVAPAPVTAQGSEAPRGEHAKSISIDRSAHFRVREQRLNAGREQIISKLRNHEPELDEMGWRELYRFARHPESSPKPEAARAALTALHKRTALCAAPLVFALCGAGLGLRTRRSGRGLGIILSLGFMIVYYLLALAAEQSARVGLVSPLTGAWLAPGLSLVTAFWLLLRNHRHARASLPFKFRGSHGVAGGINSRAEALDRPSAPPQARLPRHVFSGLLDRHLIKSLVWNFVLALVTLILIFLIFTLFELLRFMSVSGAGLEVVAKYLLFLLPMTTVALAPMSVLVAVLVAYATLARRSEAIAWWAAGQSVYRLAAPGLIFAMCVGGGVWLLQENVLPDSNRLQDELRTRIKERRNVARASTPRGRQWLATHESQALYSYQYDEEGQQLINPLIYEFDSEGVHLRRLIHGTAARWDASGRMEMEGLKIFPLGLERPAADASHGASSGNAPLANAPAASVFKPALNKPSEMGLKDLSAYLKLLKQRSASHTVVAPLAVALERKRADPFSPLVMSLLGIPLGLAFGRRSAILSITAAIFIGIAFWGANSGFLNLGAYGFLPVMVAGWAPTLIFFTVGTYLLFRART